MVARQAMKENLQCTSKYGHLRISQDICHVRMTDIEGFLTIYGHGDNLLNNNDIYCTRPTPSSDSHVTVHRHKKISLKLKTSLRNFFTGTLSSSINLNSEKSGWYQTINPNSFQIPSSGILAFELSMNDDIWKSYSAIILRIEYQTSA